MATINKTINKAGTGDAITIQGGFDLCLDDGNDYVLTITDTSFYGEQAILAQRTSGGIVTLQASTFNVYARPTIGISGVDGNLLELRADHKIIGIKFIYDEPVQGSDFRRCIYVPTGYGTTYSEVSHCQMYMGGRYFYAPGTEYGHIGYESEWDIEDVRVWNNLIRNCGFVGVKIDPQASDDIRIYNNTFVKDQEAIFIETMSANTVSIWNNIIVMDAAYSPDCIKYYAIYVNHNGKPPTDLLKLDYNCYQFLNRSLASEMWIYWSVGGVEAYTDLSTLRTAYPALEVNGQEADPSFVNYCTDYHLTHGSLALGAAETVATVTDDNDAVVRPTARAEGCYDRAWTHGFYTHW